MYTPRHYSIEDQAVIRELMTQFNFATLVSVINGEPVATQIPTLLSPSEPLTIYAHIARANPQSRTLSSSSSMFLFNGPHAYISPRHYQDGERIGTWNYASVHAYGTITLVDDPDAVLAHLLQTVRFNDPELPTDFPESLNEEMIRHIMPGLVAFEMKVDRLEAKLKNSQNRSVADREGVKQFYLSTNDPNLEWLANLLKLD